MITKAKYSDINQFEATLRTKNTYHMYNTREISLKDFVLKFKQNKKNVSVKYPLTSHHTVMTNIYRLLMRMQNHSCFIIKEDYSFVVGYYELKYLYRWMYKNMPLVTKDGMAYYYNDMSENFRRVFENQLLRIRVYSEDININQLITDYYSDDIVRFPMKNEEIIDLNSLEA